MRKINIFRRSIRVVGVVARTPTRLQAIPTSLVDIWESLPSLTLPLRYHGRRIENTALNFRLKFQPREVISSIGARYQMAERHYVTPHVHSQHAKCLRPLTSSTPTLSSWRLRPSDGFVLSLPMYLTYRLTF